MPTIDQDDTALPQEHLPVIGLHVYDMDDQQWFAGFSGDYNPLHIDAVVARREMYGEVVVHGIHGVLNALNDYLETQSSGGTPIRMERLRVRFMRPIALGTPVRTVIRQQEGQQFRLVIEDAGQTLASIDGTLALATRSVTVPPAPPENQRRSPRELSYSELSDQAGQLPLWWDAVAASTRWPSLSRLSSEGPATLCALTRLVGMECPGLRSIFSGFELAWSPQRNEEATMEYQVEHVDGRFSFAKMSVRGHSSSGIVEVFSRPPPQQQPTLAQVGRVVRPGEFDRVVALIIGGSRGIGEVTAKIVAAGGGAVLLTYRQGECEAQGIIDELTAAGAMARMARYEVGTSPVLELHDLARDLPSPINQLYYFPSPKIFVKQRPQFDPALFREFAACYVEGFAECCRISKQISQHPLHVFYPSSEALDAPVNTLTEYSAAKAAGETLCSHLDRFDQRLKVLTTRLPRIATDQTLTLTEVPSQAALDVMLPLVRQMRDMR